MHVCVFFLCVCCFYNHIYMYVVICFVCVVFCYICCFFVVWVFPLIIYSCLFFVVSIIIYTCMFFLLCVLFLQLYLYIYIYICMLFVVFCVCYRHVWFHTDTALLQPTLMHFLELLNDWGEILEWFLKTVDHFFELCIVYTVELYSLILVCLKMWYIQKLSCY